MLSRCLRTALRDIVGSNVAADSEPAATRRADTDPDGGIAATQPHRMNCLLSMATSMNRDGRLSIEGQEAVKCR